MESFRKLIITNQTLDMEYDIFKYSWSSLSAGEEILFSIYSRFYSIKDKLNDKNYLILLDEPDIFLHPEWQRNLIKTFVDFINIVFEDKKIKFQIVLTSHSPFVASDLPRENVIMLDVYDDDDEEVKNGNQEVGNCKVVTDKKIKTFGANIHNLLANSFFMKSTMGEFAKQKISDVLKDLDMEIKKEKKIDEQRQEEINYIISNIGEPVIKTKLQQMYDRVFPKDTNYLKLISDLENEIIQLTKDKENPKDGLDALKKLKEKITDYEKVLKKVGDVDDKD